MSKKAYKKQKFNNTQFTHTYDAFQNAAARMGLNMPNLMNSTEYPLSRYTDNYQEINSLYRSNWIARRIIDTPSEDMVKSWFRLDTDMTPEFEQKLETAARKINLRASILQGLKWGRLYGGAVGVLMIEGQDDILNEPLDLNAVMPNSFKGLKILDRWSGISPTNELVTNISDREYGLPKYYNLTETGFNIHHSRIIRFTGRELPYLEAMANLYWGASELEHVREELVKRDNTSYNIAMLVFSANIKALKLEGMEQVMSLGSDKAK